jgi:hypothetical protein
MELKNPMILTKDSHDRFMSRLIIVGGAVCCPDLANAFGCPVGIHWQERSSRAVSSVGVYRPKLENKRCLTFHRTM